MQAPRDSLELQLITAWSQVLDSKILDVNADFFDLGGSSLGVLRLLELIEDTTGSGLSIDDFLHEPTVSAVAEKLRRSRLAGTPDNLVVLTAPKSDELSLVCFHSVTGAMMRYALLARALEGVGVLALQSTSLLTRSGAPESVSEMASKYSDRIDHALGIDGRVIYVGYSLGGLIAIEAAAQAYKKGRPPLGLIVIDTVLDEDPEDHPTAMQILAGSLGVRDAVDFDRSEDELMEEILSAAKGVGSAPPDYEVADLNLLLEVISNHLIAAQDYIPRSYDHRIHLFRASEGHSPGVPRSSDLGWSAVTDDLVVHEFEGCNHFTIFGRSSIDQLAAAVSRVVAEQA